MMFPCGLYGILLILCIGQCIGQDLQFPDSFDAAVGESVVFALDRPPPTFSENVIIIWRFGAQTICTSTSTGTVIRPAYKDRVTVDTTTLTLKLMNLKFNDTGTYVLTITEDQTYEGQTSLQVYENVTDTKLTGPGELLIERISIANITCEGQGNITSVQWMKDNNPLNPSDNIIFSSDNRSVSINPVFRSDSGEYQCTLRNPVSFETKKLNLIVNYGPENVFIEGPDEAGLGIQVQLSCFAKSLPSASFTWTFNGTDTSVITERFNIEKSDITHSGDYICTARNNVTMQKVDSQSHILVVKEGGGGGNGGDGEGGLTTGAIVGIVIGVLVAVAGICGLIVYLTKTKRNPKVSLGKNKPTNEAPPRRQEHNKKIYFDESCKPNSTGPHSVLLYGDKTNELSYAEISHDLKSRGEGVIPRNVNESRTEYAQIMHGASAKPQAPQPPFGSQESKPSTLPEGVTYAQVMKRS